MGWRLWRRGPLGFPTPWRSRHQPGSRAAKASSPLEYIHMYGVSCMRWSILANAPIHFGECANPFYRMRLSILANVLFYSIIIIIILLLWYHYIIMLLIYFLYVVSFWHTKQSRMTLFQVSLSIAAVTRPCHRHCHESLLLLLQCGDPVTVDADLI